MTTRLNSFMSSWSLNAFVLICREFKLDTVKEVTAGGRDDDDKKSCSWPVPSQITSVSSQWQYDSSHIPPCTRAGRNITRRGDLIMWECEARREVLLSLDRTDGVHCSVRISSHHRPPARYTGRIVLSELEILMLGSNEGRGVRGQSQHLV